MLENAIAWFNARKGNVTYSMVYRNGPSSYDCSSAGYFAFKEAGIFPASMRIGNTDSLFRDFEQNGWVKVAPNAQGNFDTQRGDAVIWGKRGASSGGLGHFMLFVNANDVIHCNAYYNSIHVNNYDGLAAANGWPEATFYRFVGTNAAVNNNPVDQSVETGSFIRFDGIFTVNDVQLIGGTWQVRTDDLCEGGFTWDDNGIPTAPLVEIDNEGYATVDQELAIGAHYKIPGKFKVLDVGQGAGMWLALIEWDGLKFWIDLEDATEVDASDGGTPAPSPRPQTPPPTPVPEAPPPTQPPVVQPPTTPEPPIIVTPPVIEPPVSPKEEPKPPVINKPKENDMSFTKEQQAELKIATESVQKTIDEVAASDGVQEIVQGISKKTKLIVYFVGDTLLGLGLLVPTLAIVLEWNDLNRIVALSSLCATAGTFVLTMFGIYKAGKK